MMDDQTAEDRNSRGVYGCFALVLGAIVIVVILVIAVIGGLRSFFAS